MGKRGPKPQPTELKLIQGNPGNRPLPIDEPKPKPGIKCPTWLNADAKKIWRNLAPKLEKNGLLSEVDWPDFANLCLCVAQLQQAQKILDDANELTIKLKTKSGSEYSQQRPEVSIVHKNIDMISKLSAKFGLSPADRVGLTNPKAGEKRSKLASLLSG